VNNTKADKAACTEQTKDNEKYDKVRNAMKHPKGKASVFYTLKKTTLIKNFCFALAYLFVLALLLRRPLYLCVSLVCIGAACAVGYFFFGIL
jgi:hypothetical protein